MTARAIISVARGSAHWFHAFIFDIIMNGPITLDKTGYTDFKKLPLPREGLDISIIQFNHNVEASNTFFEYRGTLDRVTPVGVIFRSEAPLFYRFVSLGDPAIPFKASTEYNLKFNDFYTYMWAYTGGNSAEGALSLISPSKPSKPSGGKSRKRKSRKSRGGRIRFSKRN